jgi:hypothetical protein
VTASEYWGELYGVSTLWGVIELAVSGIDSTVSVVIPNN